MKFMENGGARRAVAEGLERQRPTAFDLPIIRRMVYLEVG
jgi:hypothetical protein